MGLRFRTLDTLLVCAESIPDDVLGNLQGLVVPPDDTQRFNVPPAVAMPRSFLAALQSPDLGEPPAQSLSYGIEKELQAATEEIQAQVSIFSNKLNLAFKHLCNCMPLHIACHWPLQLSS